MNKKELLFAIYGIIVIITILILCLIGVIYFPPKIEYISMNLYIYKDLGYFPFVLIISGFLTAPIYLRMRHKNEN